ncbi:MAG: CHRD domain-containing protein [Acidobacteriaceae bacterium]|nr:CHRD domain-containing protein [Acidobacteriaceae bacterium]
MKNLLCILAFVLTTAGITNAAPITFFGLISGANENPATGSPGTGTATVTYDPVTHLLGVDVAFSGLEAGTTASHIHCCILPDGNTGVATTVPTFANFPLGVESGTYVNTLDLTLASSFNPAFVTANGGTVSSAEAALATGLEDGMAYLNIHTTAFPNGEVRAFLTTVPEPSSVMLLAIAGAALVLFSRRQGRT